MKRVLFLASHLCSGSDGLFRSACDHPRIEGYGTGVSYESVRDLIALTSLPHKADDSSAVYMDELLLNHCITSRSVYRHCHFVFVAREPRGTLNEIVGTKGYTWDGAVSHYVLRLERLCSIARVARRSVFLTGDDLEGGRGGDLIAEMLSLGEVVRIDGPVWEPVEDAVPQRHLIECRRVYDRVCGILGRLCLSVSGGSSIRCGN